MAVRHAAPQDLSGQALCHALHPGLEQRVEQLSQPRNARDARGGSCAVDTAT